jgi:hypothetical protein
MYYDKDSVLSCGSGLVGWTQSTDSDHFLLSSANLQSTSGYYVNALPGIEWEIITEAIGNETAVMNTYLNDMRNQELIKLVNRSVQDIKDQLETKELLSNFDPVAGRASQSDKITQDARFVGFVIYPTESNNLRAQIKKIGMQLDTIQTHPVKIYLYDSSQKDAIATYEYTNSKTFSLEWKEVSDFVIKYRGDGTGQTFLLGYY